MPEQAKPPYQPPVELVTRAEQLLASASPLEIAAADLLWRAHYRWLGGMSSAGGAPLPATLAECRPVPAAAHLLMFREALAFLSGFLEDGPRAGLAPEEGQASSLFPGKVGLLAAQLRRAPPMLVGYPMGAPSFHERLAAKESEWPLPPGYDPALWARLAPVERRRAWLRRHRATASAHLDKYEENTFHAYIRRVMAGEEPALEPQQGPLYDTRSSAPLLCGCHAANLEVLTEEGHRLPSSQFPEFVITMDTTRGVLGVHEVHPETVRCAHGVLNAALRTDENGQPVLTERVVRFTLRCCNHPGRPLQQRARVLPEGEPPGAEPVVTAVVNGEAVVLRLEPGATVEEVRHVAVTHFAYPEPTRFEPRLEDGTLVEPSAAVESLGMHGHWRIVLFPPVGWGG